MENAACLTADELDQLEEILSDNDNIISETELNDIMWFNFDYICNLLGYTYNDDTAEIERD